MWGPLKGWLCCLGPTWLKVALLSWRKVAFLSWLKVAQGGFAILALKVAYSACAAHVQTGLQHTIKECTVIRI